MSEWMPDDFPPNVPVGQDVGEQELALLPVRDTVMFPRMTAPLLVHRERSVRAVESATVGDHRIIVVAQRDPETQNPGLDDLYGIGTEAVVGRVLHMPDQTTS